MSNKIEEFEHINQFGFKYKREFYFLKLMTIKGNGLNCICKGCFLEASAYGEDDLDEICDIVEGRHCDIIYTPEGEHDKQYIYVKK